MHHTPNFHSRVAPISLAVILACGLLLGLGKLSPIARATPAVELASNTVYLPLVTTSFVACNDIEDNDIPAQAQPLTTLGHECLGAFEDDPVGEDDYYAVTLNPGQSITVELRSMPTGADYDLLLYRAMELVASSNEQGTTSERLSYTNTSNLTTTYLIRINMYAKATSSTNTYVLKTSGA